MDIDPPVPVDDPDDAPWRVWDALDKLTWDQSERDVNPLIEAGYVEAWGIPIRKFLNDACYVEAPQSQLPHVPRALSLGCG